MARTSPASTKTHQQNATKLGDVDGYLGAQCEPEMCVLWKITSGNFYIAKSEKKYIYSAVCMPCQVFLLFDFWAPFLMGRQAPAALNPSTNCYINKCFCSLGNFYAFRLSYWVEINIYTRIRENSIAIHTYSVLGFFIWESFFKKNIVKKFYVSFLLI